MSYIGCGRCMVGSSNPDHATIGPSEPWEWATHIVGPLTLKVLPTTIYRNPMAKLALDRAMNFEGARVSRAKKVGVRRKAASLACRCHSPSHMISFIGKDEPQLRNTILLTLVKNHPFLSF